MKHSAFVSRIHKAHEKPSARRRRPSKKLVATLESLADALPELDPLADGNIEQLREGRVRHRSLKSKPGALRRKERLVKGEVERFGASMARLAAVPDASGRTRAAPGTSKKNRTEADESVRAAAPPPVATTNRWAALRNYISTTMEQNPAFTKAES